MKKFRKAGILILALMFVISQSLVVSAHSGRTDSSGGHHDYKNVSGLGSYHYHCGGHPAHLHKNGVCPYDSHTSHSNSGHSHHTTTKKTTVSKYYKKATVKKVQKKLRSLGYKCGRADGKYDTKVKHSIKHFQKRYGLKATGKIDKQFIKKMRIKI